MLPVGDFWRRTTNCERIEKGKIKIFFIQSERQKCREVTEASSPCLYLGLLSSKSSLLLASFGPASTSVPRLTQLTTPSRRHCTAPVPRHVPPSPPLQPTFPYPFLFSTRNDLAHKWGQGTVNIINPLNSPLRNGCKSRHSTHLINYSSTEDENVTSI